MKAFLFIDCPEISTNYHSGGAVLIEAENEGQALELAFFDAEGVDSDGGWASLKKPMKLGKLAAVFASESKEPKLWIFPDAGCC